MPIIDPMTFGDSGSQSSYEFMMAGENPFDEPYSLLGASVTSPSQTLTDPVTRIVVEKRRGKIVKFSKVVKLGQQTELTYTIGFGPFLWTPALHRARHFGECAVDFFAIRNCPDPKDLHAYIYPDSTLDKPVEAGDFITNDDSDEVLSEQTTLRTTERQIVWALNYTETSVDTDELYGVTFVAEECPGCVATLNTDLVAVGGDATAAGTIFATDDRFTSQTSLTSQIPAGSDASSVWAEGNERLVGFNATTVSGGVVYSADGTNFMVDANLTEPVLAVGRFAGYFFAVGGTGTGKVWTSKNGIDWTLLNSSVLTAAAVLAGFAVDNENRYAYVVGGAEAYRISQFADSFTVEDITANLAGAPAGLISVAVGRAGHVAVGGASAYYAESFDDGETFEQVVVGGSSAVGGIALSRNRALVGVGTSIYERSVLSLNKFEVKYTSAGTITDIKEAYDDEDNYFAASTTGGGVIFAKPQYPLA